MHHEQKGNTLDGIDPGANGNCRGVEKRLRYVHMEQRAGEQMNKKLCINGMGAMITQPARHHLSVHKGRAKSFSPSIGPGLD